MKNLGIPVLLLVLVMAVSSTGIAETYGLGQEKSVGVEITIGGYAELNLPDTLSLDIKWGEPFEQYEISSFDYKVNCDVNVEVSSPGFSNELDGWIEYRLESFNENVSTLGSIKPGESDTFTVYYDGKGSGTLSFQVIIEDIPGNWYEVEAKGSEDPYTDTITWTVTATE